jgi:hypothetical protein
MINQRPTITQKLLVGSEILLSLDTNLDHFNRQDLPLNALFEGKCCNNSAASNFAHDSYISVTRSN